MKPVTDDLTVPLGELEELLIRVEDQIGEFLVEQRAAARLRSGDAAQASDARRAFAELGLVFDK